MNFKIDETEGTKLLARLEAAWPGVADLIRAETLKGLMKGNGIEVSDIYDDMRLDIANAASGIVVPDMPDKTLDKLAIGLVTAQMALISIAVQNMFAGLSQGLINSADLSKDITDKPDVVRIAMLMSAMPVIDKWADEYKKVVAAHVNACIVEHINIIINTLEKRIEDGEDRF